MRRYHWVRLYALLLMIILFFTAFLASAKSGLGILKESARQRSVVRSVQGISGATTAMIADLSQTAGTAGEEQYTQLLELVKIEDDSSLSENDLENYYRAGFANRIEETVGTNATQISGYLNDILARSAVENVTVIDDGRAAFEEETDNDGNMVGLWLKDISVSYDDPVIGKRQDSISFKFNFPDAVFHSGNDELFRYCMVARKGIYITGRTSSVIGDVFAGKHTAEECREAEIVYGETGTYGGINILSTQLGAKCDRIITEGDINVNGSFVMISPISNDLSCYGKKINEIGGFSKDAQCTLDGEFIQTDRMDEQELKIYHDAINLVDISLAPLEPLSLYYDSDNDREYTGKYRKLISGSDVELKDDFTGIVATRANVIIHKDVNFEGIILCGDRIYAMGNNNIVANAQVARSLIASETEGASGIKIRDNIGGMKAAGLTPPEYYVVPYR